MQPDTIIPSPANPQSWNRYSYALNNPIKYNDPDGHCVPLCVGLLVVGVALLGVAPVISGYQKMEVANQHQDVMRAETIAVSQWQDNCMGQCHYSHSVTPTPGYQISGPRPASPVSDLHAEGSLDILLGLTSIFEGVTIGASVTRLSQLPAKGIPRSGADVAQDLFAISDGARPATVRPGEDALEWFHKIIGGQDNALPFLSIKPKAPTLYGNVPGGGTAFYRPFTSTNPVIELNGVKNLPKHIKFHFPE